MNVKKSVIIRIQQLCAERHITLNTLANISGLTPSSLYSITDKRRSDIGIVLIKKICDGMNISMSEFFNDSVFSELEQEVK